MKYSKRFAVALAAALGTGAAFASGSAWSHVADGTNVWIGAASGGSMKNLANWKAIVKGVEYTDAVSVSNLFTKHVALDLRGLASGAVLTNDITFGNTYNERDSAKFTMISGLWVSGEADATWTITRNGGNGLFPCAPCYLQIDGGTLVWDDGGATAFYPQKIPHKRGTGILRFAKIPYFWETDGYVDAGTLAFAGVSSTTYNWKIANDATVDIEKGASSAISYIAQVFSDATAANAALNVKEGTTLILSSGFNTYKSSYSFYGDVTGTGTLEVRGGGVHRFRAAGDRTALGFTGLCQAYVGELEFGAAGSPLAFNPAVSLGIAATGGLRFFGDVTCATLTGSGVDGTLAVPAGKTVTVTGPASGATTNTFAGRLAGGGLVKRGKDYDLTLTGASIYSGETRVEEGTLRLKRSATRSGLRVYWNFEDPDNMGADASIDGALPLALRANSTARPYLVEDGVSGRALHFGNGKDMTKGGQFFRHCAKSPHLGSVPALVPKGAADPFTVSFWIRPAKGLCGNGPNFLRIGAANGDITIEDGTGSKNVGWSNQCFFFGSVRRDETTPTKLLSPFENLCFYCGTGWTRAGAWDEGGTSKLYAKQVAIAKFSDKNYLLDGNWHHIVGTYSNRLMRIFVDGVKMDERTRDGDLYPQVDPYVQLGSYSDSDSIHCFQGDLDEVQWVEGAWDEQTVLAEYQAKNHAPKGSLLPEPVAHWTFDVQKVDKGFADVTGHGYDLEAKTSDSAVTVGQATITYTDDPTATGKAASITKKGPYLQLPEGKTFTDRIPEGGSFTLSMRTADRQTANYFLFGDGTTKGSIYLRDDGCPRNQIWTIGLNSSSASSWTKQFTDTGLLGDWQTAYVTTTIVYDAPRTTLCIYRDGNLLYISNDHSLTLKPQKLMWGRVGDNYAASLRLDDLRIYGEALSGAQVAALARCVRYGGTKGDAAAEAMPVLPADSTVTVSAGATLATAGTAEQTLKALAGAGTLAVGAGSSVRVNDLTAFAGAVKGAGTLLVAPGQTVALAAEKVSADVGFADDTIVVSEARKGESIVRTSARVRLPKAGTIRLEGATSPLDFLGKRFVIAECASADIPADLSGWTLDPSSATPLKFAFRFANGVLSVRFSGGGSALILR